MPRDLSGVYTLPSGYEAVTGETIEPSQHNPPLEDLASAMTGSLPRNGAAAMTGNLAMGSYKITGLADGVADGDAVNKSQLDASVVSSSSPAGGRKNLLTNAPFWISQRYGSTAVNVSDTVIYYPVDRWLARLTSTASGTLTAQRVVDASDDYALRLLRSSGSYLGAIWSGIVLEERQINALRAGGDVTLSMTVRTGTAFNGDAAFVMVASPATGQTADNAFISGWTTETRTVVDLDTLTPGAPTTTEQRYSHTFTVPAGTKSLYFGISTGNFTGSGSANDWLQFKLPQLEIGDTATDFQYPDEQQDRFECYRYCFVVEAVGVAIVGSAYLGGSTSARGCVTTPVPLRASPTITATASEIRVYANGTYTPSAVASSAAAVSENGVVLTLTISGGTSGLGGAMALTSGGKIRLDAEI